MIGAGRRLPLVVGVGAVAVALLCAGCDAIRRPPPPPPASGPVIDTELGTATPYGTGAARVWVLRPTAWRTRSVVVYLHGYGANLPFEWHLAVDGSPARAGEHRDLPPVPGRRRRPVRPDAPYDLARASDRLPTRSSTTGSPSSQRASRSARRWRSSTRPTPRNGVSRRRAPCTRSSRSIRSSSIVELDLSRSRTRSAAARRRPRRRRRPGRRAASILNGPGRPPGLARRSSA